MQNIQNLPKVRHVRLLENQAQRHFSSVKSELASNCTLYLAIIAIIKQAYVYFIKILSL